jgi:hypothetical protein
MSDVVAELKFARQRDGLRNASQVCIGAFING